MASIYKKIGKYVISSVSACSGALIFYYGFYPNERKSAFSSWTTGHIPAGPQWDTNWDHRDPASLVKPTKDDEKQKEELKRVKAQATRHIFLIRHGQYHLDGSNDSQRFLTDLGKQQAKHTGERLKELNYPFSLMVKSTMTRAQETGNIIMSVLKNDNITVEDCKLLEEGAPIPPEPPVGHWKPETYFYQDGPRIEAAFRKHIHRAEYTQTEDSYELIVCHANVIRYFVCRALQFPPDAWLRFTLHHCSITWIAITPSGRVILRSLGDFGHMPPAAVTTS